MYGTVSYRRKRSASVSAETMRGMMVGTLTLNSSFSEIESSSHSNRVFLVIPFFSQDRCMRSKMSDK